LETNDLMMNYPAALKWLEERTKTTNEN